MTIPIEEYEFKEFGQSRSYIVNMPYIDTDQLAGRLHVCPICDARRWSCFANARKHWEVHETEQRKRDEDPTLR